MLARARRRHLPPPAPTPVQVGTAGAMSAGGTARATFAVAPKAGNVLVAVIGSLPSGATEAWPSGFAAGPSASLGSSHPMITTWLKIADGSELSVSFSGDANQGGIQIYEIAHVGTNFGAYISNTSTSGSATSFAAPPVSPTGPAVVLTAASNYTWPSDAQISAPWVEDCLLLNPRDLLAAHQVLDASGAVSGTYSRASAGTLPEAAFVTLALQ